MKELIREVALKNQNEAHRRVTKYYLMRALILPVWVYNPRASPPDWDKLDNKKLGMSWARPYLFEGMQNPTMAKIGRVNESGQVVRRFLVYGCKVRLCQMGGELVDDQRQWKVRPGMLPDFTDREVSGPLYWLEEQQEDPAEKRELVWQRTFSPLTEVPDEALRTDVKNNNQEEPTPQWLEVEDELMEERMSEDEAEWRVRDWLSHTKRTQDSVSVCEEMGGEEPGEPMIWDNHGASDQSVCDRMWKHAQCQTDKDRKPRIGLQSNIREAPNVES